MSTAKAALRSKPATDISREAAIFGRPTLFFALALSLGVSGIYLFTLSSNYSPDSMAFAVLATRGDLSQPLFFQAEHLLYPFVGWQWYQLWVFFGYEQGALAPMQVLSALGGAAGAGLFFLSLRLLLGSSRSAMLISMFCALFLAGTYGYWYHSTEAEDQIISNALVLAAFLLLVYRLTETNRDWYSLYGVKPNRFQKIGIRLGRSRVFLALMLSLATLVHATAVLFLPALLLGLWLKDRDIRSELILLAEVVAIVGVAFATVGWFAHDFRSPGEYISWLFSAPSHGVWGKFSLRNPWTGAQTMANALVFLQGGISFKALLGGVFQWRNTLGAFFFVSSWAMIALVAVYFVRFRHRLAGWWIAALVCMAWFVAFGLFNLYWAPEDIQFWVALAPPVIVTLSIAHLDMVGRMKPREEQLNGVFVFGLASIFVVNLITAIIPRANPANNAGLYNSLCIERASGPNDLIITPGWDWASSYVPYFTGRQLLSIVDTYLLSARGDRSMLLRLVDQRVAETMSKGGKVYVVRLYGLDHNDSSWFQRTTGLTADDFPYKRQRAWECGGEVVWEVVRQ